MLQDDEVGDAPAPAVARYELRFRSMAHPGRGFAFDCDALGEVDLDRVSASVRASYLGARAAVGRELLEPQVLPVVRARTVRSFNDAVDR